MGKIKSNLKSKIPNLKTETHKSEGESERLIET